MHHAACRRSLQPREVRPFSDFYGEDFVPLDDDIVRSPYNNHTFELRQQNGSSVRNLEDDFAVNVDQGESTAGDNEGNSSQVEDEQTASNSLINGHERDDLVDGAAEGDGTIVAMETTANSDHLSTPYQQTHRESVGSIELTEDSPLRILEESEIVHEQEANDEAEMEESIVDDLEIDETEESLEAEQQESMDTAEADSLSNSEESTFEASPTNLSLSSNQSAQTVSGSQEEALQILDEVMADSDQLICQRTDSPPLPGEGDVRSTLSPLPERVSSTVFQPEPQCVRGPSVASTLMVPNTNDANNLTVTCSSDADLSMRSANTTRPDSIGTLTSVAATSNSLEEPVASLVEDVEQIVGENQPAIENEQSTSQARTNFSRETSPHNPVTVSRESLPMEEGEPMCLDMASLHSVSATERPVASPSTVPHPSSTSASPSDLSSSSLSPQSTSGIEASPQQDRSPQASKRISRSKSESQRSSPKSRKSERGRQRERERSRLTHESGAEAHRQQTRVGSLQGTSHHTPVARRGSLPTRTVASVTSSVSTAGSASDPVLVAEAVASDESSVVVAAALPSTSVAVTPIMSPTLLSDDDPMAAALSGRETTSTTVVARPVLVSRGAASATERLGEGMAAMAVVSETGGRRRSSTLPVGSDFASSSSESLSSLPIGGTDESGVIYAKAVPSSPSAKNNGRKKGTPNPSRDTISSLLKSYVRTAQVTQTTGPHPEHTNIIEASAHPVEAIARGHRRIRPESNELTDEGDQPARPRRTRHRQRTHPVHMQIQDEQQRSPQQSQQNMDNSNEPLPPSKLIMCVRVFVTEQTCFE